MALGYEPLAKPLGCAATTLKIFDQAWKDTLMVMDSELDVAFVEGLSCRQLEMSTLMKNALALYHTDQVHRKEPQSYRELKTMITDMLEDQQ